MTPHRSNTARAAIVARMLAPSAAAPPAGQGTANAVSQQLFGSAPSGARRARGCGTWLGGPREERTLVSSASGSGGATDQNVAKAEENVAAAHAASPREEEEKEAPKETEEEEKEPWVDAENVCF